MYSQYEKIAKEKGYRVDEFGKAFNKHGKEVGTIGSRGYRYFAYRDKNNKIIKVFIHRMQAYQKYGNLLYEEGILVRHLNGNPLDNSINNIETGTALDNYYDIPQAKRLENDEKLRKLSLENAVKYTEEQVLEIQEKHKKGVTYKELMQEYNISSKGTLSYIINYRGGV